jgi:hypothetical protein
VLPPQGELDFRTRNLGALGKLLRALGRLVRPLERTPGLWRLGRQRYVRLVKPASGRS